VETGSNVVDGGFQIPVMVNGIYHIPLDLPIKPFVGAGVGGVLSIASDDVDSEEAFAFGYQGLIGAKYQITDRAELGAVYKILGTTDLEFDTFETKGSLAHMLALAFTYKF
jgi:OOP family OmpA-OmpF porin